jgi:hypothetical protein
VPVDIEKLNAILANWINTPNEMHPPNLLSASEREITRRVACPETCFWCSPNEFFIVAAGGGRWAPSPGPRRLLLAGRFSTETFSAPISSAANGQALVLASSGARSASPVSLRPWWQAKAHLHMNLFVCLANSSAAVSSRRKQDRFRCHQVRTGRKNCGRTGEKTMLYRWRAK